jgi:hypothetical protein
MKLKYPVEFLVFVLSLIIFNFTPAARSAAYYLFPSALFDGEISRWLTFAWKHNSVYHLILDATAFLFLYESLRCRLAGRLLHLVSCIFFSGLIPIIMDPRVAQLGLCGLSGVAHGLMLIWAFESAEQTDKRSRIAASVLFLGVLGKTTFEQVTGQVLFADHHLGNVGVPIASCHFGGIVGAILSYSILHAARTLPLSSFIFRPLPAQSHHADSQIPAAAAGHAHFQRHLRGSHVRAR